ncbi:MAG: efflux RND transporter periplasmic adaptor subunit [Nitrospinae bacterium]|nr:efflux RND transporter periplasmic adaptor subunit [Nitrospinota bacterium]
MKIVLFVFVLALAGTAQARELSASRIATGVVAPNRAVTLSAKIMGRVEQVTREEGETVKAGGLLLSIADAEWRAGLLSAQAALARADAEYSYKKKMEAKMKALFEQRTVSEDMVDQAALDAEVARASLQSAEASVALAQTRLDETHINAPFDAVVINKSAEVGQMTAPGQPLFVIEDHSRLKFRTAVKERDVTAIKPGQKARVTIDALGGAELKGVVAKVIPSGDPVTHSYTVEISLPPRKGVYPGMFGKAEFGD